MKPHDSKMSFTSCLFEFLTSDLLSWVMRLCATISSYYRYQKCPVRNFLELQVFCSSFAGTSSNVFFLQCSVVNQCLTVNPVFHSKNPPIIFPSQVFHVLLPLNFAPSHPTSTLILILVKNQNTCVY